MVTGASHHISLGTGTLTVSVARADWPLDSLCSFAARNNPRRAFLVVSNVLGRHIGVAPHVMRATFRDLAARLPADLPGPVLIIGLAETAICLGQGVHEDYLKQTGRDDVMFLHSTRQRLDHPLLVQFEEPHSHASTHLVYRPHDPEGRFAAPRALVMVDDEISTGQTLTNLAAATIRAWPSIDVVVAATLTNWSLGRAWTDQIARPASVVSLLDGTLAWTGPTHHPALVSGEFDRAAAALGAMASHHNFGRLGRTDVANECDRLAAQLSIPAASALRVVGTGEFTYAPFRIAEILEDNGHDVIVQSTTRSPIHCDGPIATRIQFVDNYGTDVANYLYNVDQPDRRMTILCHETPRGSLDPALIAALDAQTVYCGGDR
jgi:hypothetical protein